MEVILCKTKCINIAPVWNKERSLNKGSWITSECWIIRVDFQEYVSDLHIALKMRSYSISLPKCINDSILMLFVKNKKEYARKFPKIVLAKPNSSLV